MTLRHARGLLKVFPAVAAVCLAGCATHVDLGMGAPPAPSVGRGVQLRVTPFEHDFALQAAAKGLYEIEVSRLAASRALNPAVRNYAQTMVAHYTQSNNELVALMNARGVPAPHTLSDDKAIKLRRLAALPPSDAFDSGYIRVVGIEDHQEAIASFEKARAEVVDGELRTWIERNLLALRTHLSMAQSIAGTLEG